jgi:outer membrane protein insertion porin family
MRRVPVILALIAVILPFAGIFGQQSFFLNPTIKDIRFSGLINSSESDVRDLIFIRKGEALRETDLNRTIKTLAGLDMFKNVKADIEEAADGLIVTLIFEENPYIHDAKFDGNKSYGSDDLKKETEFQDPTFFSAAKMDRSIKGISKKYEEDGFIEATSTYELQPVAGKTNTFDVLFKVAEGNKIVVERIDITGAVRITASDIKGKLKTKEKVFILQSGVFKAEDFEEDRQLVQAYYEHMGMLDVKLKRFDWKVEDIGTDKEKHKGIVVTIDIDEGEIYTTGKFKLSGNQIYTTNELMGYLTLKEGSVFDKIAVEQNRMDIYNRYSDGGHLFANVSLVLDKNSTNHVVNTEMVIYEGPLAHIENILIQGNTKTATNVIRRELLFSEGELYIQSKVRQSYDKLQQLQYFEEVSPQYTPGSAEGLVNLEVNVKEQRTGMITFGAGYGTVSGFNGTAQIQEKNLFGTGRIVSLKGTVGQYQQSIDLSFQEPWLFNDPTFASLSFNVSRYIYQNEAVDNGHGVILNGTDSIYTNDFNWEENSNTTLSGFTSPYQYFSDNFSIGLNLSRRFFVDWNLYGGYTFTMYRNYVGTASQGGWDFTNYLPLVYGLDGWQVDTNLTNELSKGLEIKHTVGTGIGFNNTDDPLNPLRGATFNLDFSYVGGVFGGTIDYLRPRFSFNWYLNPFWKFVFAFHTSADALLPQFGQSQPIYDTADLLRFDGQYEMRGWQNYIVYAESKFYDSAEFRFPIYSKELWGVLFFDYGALFGSYNDFTYRLVPGDIESFGIGAKINIPMLPIRLYLARQMHWEESENRFMLGNAVTSSQRFLDDWTVVFTIQGLF